MNQETFSGREDCPLRHQQAFGSNEPFFGLLNSAKPLLDGNRNHMLAGAGSELMKQEKRVDSLNTCILEHQRPTHSQRLELDDAHGGYEESRREQVRLPEEFVMKEKALRDTRIRGIHEMEELRRAQELRVDEFTEHEIEIQELQERVNCMNDSTEFH